MNPAVWWLLIVWAFLTGMSVMSVVRAQRDLRRLVREQEAEIQWTEDQL